MERKYEFTEETISYQGRTLHRIRLLKPIRALDAGEMGGYIESYDNLAQDGDACVYGDAKVFGDARVSGNAEVRGNASIVCAMDYIVFKNFWSSGRYFTWTRINNKWKVGCFYGTGKELIAKAYKDSEKSGREYERVVRYVESVLADEKTKS